MKAKYLHLAVISDIHLGHRRNVTEEIIRNLRKYLTDEAFLASLDLLVLAGDVFDGLLYLSHDAIPEIDFWIIRLLSLCKKHNVLLRVLEGTPSHDYKQSKRFVTLNDGYGINASLKYIPELSIEFIEELGITALYVPDEVDSNTDNVFAQVRELMLSKGLEQVDYAFMHGQFEYQLPDFISAPKHSSKNYLSIIKHLIFIGHIHTHSMFERIIAQGSFDRLSHNEEEEKGFVKAKVWSEDKYEIEFVINKESKKFVTIDCTNLSHQDSLEVIDRTVFKLPNDSHVRILAEASHPFIVGLEEVVKIYPTMQWAKKIQETEKPQSLFEQEKEEDKYHAVTITKDNIMDFLMRKIGSEDLSSGVLVRSKLMLEKLI